MNTTPNEFDSEFNTHPLDSLPPLPPSDFTFSDLLHKQHQQINSDSFFLDSYLFRSDSLFLNSSLSQDDSLFLDSSLSQADSLFLDSSLSLLNHHHLTESTQFQNLLNENNFQFLHLPDLKSIDQTASEDTKTKPFLSLSPPSSKRRRKTLGSSSSSSTNSGSPIENHATRRKKISDKIRSLEKIMPWESKMSLAMVLEESYKYIKFLQSQIDVLRWMPLESVYNTAGEFGEIDLLKSLTRQQILQVLANSPGSRNLLAKRGVCVFSYEQLLSLKTMSRNL